MLKNLFKIPLIISLAAASNMSADIIGFSDVVLNEELFSNPGASPSSNWNQIITTTSEGVDYSSYVSVASRSVSRSLSYYDYFSFEGFAFSKIAQVTEDNYESNFVSATLGGANEDGSVDTDKTYAIFGSHLYGVLNPLNPYRNEYNVVHVVDFSGLGESVAGMYISNTLQSVAEINELFVTGDGSTFSVLIFAWDKDGSALNEGNPIEVYLADFRDGKGDIVTEWLYVDLTIFTPNGETIGYLDFATSSSLEDDVWWYFNYFAIGGFVTELVDIPEPAEVAALLGFAALGLAAWRRKSKRLVS